MSHSSHKQSILKEINFIPDKKWTLIGIAAVIISAGLLFYNALFGLGTPDEPFYFTIPYRIIKGDALFINEWHASLLSSFLQYPFLLLFTKLTGSAEGIILYFRILFIIFQAGVSSFIFMKMRRFGFTTAIILSLLFELYAPEYVLSLDYYTLSLLPITIASLILIFDENISRLKYVLCGVLFACAVLAEPPLALSYFGLFISIIVLTKLKKKKDKLFNFKSFIYLSIGIIIVAALFFVFILTQASPSEILPAIKNIFRSGEYSNDTFLSGYWMYAKSLFRDFSWASAAAGIYLAVILLDKNRQKHKLLWAFAAALIAVACIIIATVNIIKNSNIIPLVNIPFVFAFLGISSFILQKNKNYKLLWIWLTGFAYCVLVFTISVASDYSGSYGFVLSNIASIPIIFGFCSELSEEINGKKTFLKEKINRKEEKAVVLSISAVIIAICIFCLGIQTYALFLRDIPGYVMGRGEFRETVSVEKGAYKGIRITQKQNEVYNDILEDIANIESKTDGKYTVLSDNSWYIFSSDRPPLAFTLWYIDSKKESYLDYYNYLSEMPEYIFIVNQNLFSGDAGSKIDVSEKLSYFMTNLNCAVTEGKTGYILKIN